MGQTAGEIRYDIEQTRSRMSATIDAIGYRLDIPARMRYRFSHIMHDVGGVFTGKPEHGNGGEPGIIAKGEEMVGSALQAAQSGVTGMAGAVEERLSGIGQTVQSGLSEIKESVVDRMTSGSSDVYGTGRGTETSTTEQVRDTATGTWRRMGSFARDNALALSLGALAVGVIAGVFIPRSRIEQERIAPLAGELKHKAVETGEKVLHKGQQMVEETLSGQGGGETGGAAQQQESEPVTAGQSYRQHYGAEREQYRQGD